MHIGSPAFPDQGLVRKYAYKHDAQLRDKKYFLWTKKQIQDKGVRREAGAYQTRLIEKNIGI